MADLGGSLALGLQPLFPFGLAYQVLDPDQRFRLSPHAVRRVLSGDLIWEEPSVPALVRTYGCHVEAFWPKLAKGTTARTLGENLGYELAEVQRCLELLLCGGLIQAADTDLAPRLMWSAREAWLHAQTVFGRSDTPLGGTFPFLADIPTPPAPSVRGEEQLLLPRGGLGSMTLQDALQRRRSRRSAANPLDFARLGAFLWHAARVTSVDNGGAYQVLRRPYATGGGLGELEIYILIQNCDGLHAGLYYYEALNHALTKIHTDAGNLTDVAASAAMAVNSPGAHHAILFVTARMDLSLWKYSGIAYSLALRNLGGLHQCSALTAAALNLAICPIGLLPGSAFAAMTQTDPWKDALLGGMTLNG